MWLRGWDPLATLHGWLGLLAALLFAGVGVLGLRLRAGDRRLVSAHGLAGLLAVMIAALAAMAGFVLLP